MSCSAGPKDADTSELMSAYRKRNDFPRLFEDYTDNEWEQEEEYAVKLSPISQPVLPPHLRDFKPPDGPLLYFGFQLGIDVAERKTQQTLFIEHINRYYREGNAISLEMENGIPWFEAVATAYLHIECEINKLKNTHLDCRQVSVVSDMYHPAIPTTVTFALCSNQRTHDPYGYFGRDKVEKVCEVMKAVLNLGDDATPKWYFSYKRHGAKAHNFEPFNQPRTQPPLKAEKATRPSS